MSHNPNLDQRLVQYLRERCKTAVDEAALDLIHDIEKPFVVCEGGWHAEFLIRRLSDHQVQYLASDDGWEPLEAGDSIIQLILAGFVKRFYGPEQIKVVLEECDKTYQYIVYNMNLASRKL